MASASNVNQSSKTCCSFFLEIKCKKEHVIAAVVGSVLIALGIILRFYPGVNSVVMASMIAAGGVILIVDLFLARAEDKLKPRSRKSSFESVLDDVKPPPTLQEVVKNISPKFDSSELLAIALDTGKIADVERIIANYIKKTPELLNARYDNKKPLQRALHNYFNQKNLSNYFKIKVLYEAGATCQINGLSPFAFICKELISKSEGVAIETNAEDRSLLVMFRSKDDEDLKREVDSLKTYFAGSQLRLVEEQLFVFARQLKG